MTVYYHITCDERDCVNELVATGDDPDTAEGKADELWHEVGGFYEHHTSGYVCWDCAAEDEA